jgi:hypothetical protein
MQIHFNTFLNSSFTLLKEKILIPQNQKIVAIVSASLALLAAAFLIFKRYSFKSASHSKSTPSGDINNELETKKGGDEELSEEDLAHDSIEVNQTLELLIKKIPDENSQGCDPFAKLPNELLMRILLSLSQTKDWMATSSINQSFHRLSQHPQIIAARLENEKLRIPVFQYLQMAKQAGLYLKKIDLSTTSLNDQQLEDLLKACPNIEMMNLAWCSNITDASLANLQHFAALQSLNLFGCYNITDAGLLNLQQFTALQYLNLGGCKNITDTGLVNLQHLTALQYLNLAWCSNINAGLVNLQHLTALQSLSLTGCKNITDAGLAHLQHLTALQSLELARCSNITDAGLAHLQYFAALQSLNLFECYTITDAGLAHLQHLTALQSLNLERCHNITDAGLAHLHRLAALQSLNLEKCYNITDVGLANLQHFAPLCKFWT